MKAIDQPRLIYDFLRRNRGVDYCDDCLGEATHVDRHHVNTIASTMSLFPKEFSRRSAVCPQPTCQSRGRDKLVTRAV